MKKKIAFFTAFILAISSIGLVGCGEKNTEPTAEEIKQQEMMTLLKTSQQNDYMGGIQRIQALKNDVLSTVEKMKSNNGIIRNENPNSYWEKEGYQDFVSSFLTCSLIEDTKDFNEEKAEWSSTVGHMATSPNTFTRMVDGAYTLKEGVSIKRNEKDDYIVSGLPITYSGVIETTDGTQAFNAGSEKSNIRILYDCDKDWCQSFTEANLMGNSEYLAKKNSFAQMFEYMRLDENNFVIQTETERLYIVLQPVEKDTVIFNREIKEFYYSRLTKTGNRTTFTPYEYLPEVSEEGEKLELNKEKNKDMAKMPYLNADGDLFNQYGKKESAFLNVAEKTEDKWTFNGNPVTDWIFEDKSLQQAICFKDGVLVATTYNKLSQSYERFTYEVADADEAIKPALEAMVEIKNLVGVQKAEVKDETEEIEEENTTAETKNETTTLAPETAVTEPTEETTGDENGDETITSEPLSEENTETEAEDEEAETEEVTA